MDLVEMERVATLDAMHRDRCERFLAAAELAGANRLEGARRVRYLAGRFAVKEAFVKAVGGPAGVEPRDIGCVDGPAGQPRLDLGASARTALERSGCSDGAVTVSHGAGMAIAAVFLY